jgi:hypothetical protein
MCPKEVLQHGHAWLKPHCAAGAAAEPVPESPQPQAAFWQRWWLPPLPLPLPLL